jgi:hypothetical protein
MLPARTRRDFDDIPQGARDKLELSGWNASTIDCRSAGREHTGSRCRRLKDIADIEVEIGLVAAAGPKRLPRREPINSEWSVDVRFGTHSG